MDKSQWKRWEKWSNGKNQESSRHFVKKVREKVRGWILKSNDSHFAFSVPKGFGN